MSDILCHYCKHAIREHHRNLGCFGDYENCPCGLDEVTVAKIALDAANAKLAATRALAAMWDENAAACDREAVSQVGVNRMGLEIEALYDRRHARLIRDAVGEDQ